MAEAQATVLVVDADRTAAAQLTAVVEEMGHRAEWIGSGRDALTRLAQTPFDVILTELDLPDMTGSELVGEVQRCWPEVAAVVVAGEATVTRAVGAMKAGATDFLLKPCDRAEVLQVLERALARAQLAAELPPPSSIANARPSLLGRSPALRSALDVARKAASGNATVLIRGETGTGKELVARLVHDLGPRGQGPFVKVQCSALPDSLLESELFGYERGAFTGANTRKPGRVELADGGTLFLDEIGDIALSMQVKLLRLLQDREYERLGGTKPLRADVRFVTATFRDLEAMVKAGTFREDLFYRLNVVTVWLPPLRARREDVPELAEHFAHAFAPGSAKHSVTFERRALELLAAERWPGNVRQLENLVERLVVLADGPVITADAVARELGVQTTFVTQSIAYRSGTDRQQSSVVGPLDEKMRRAERHALERALAQAAGNRSLAARLLGVSRRTLYNKLAAHGLE